MCSVPCLRITPCLPINIKLSFLYRNKGSRYRYRARFLSDLIMCCKKKRGGIVSNSCLTLDNRRNRDRIKRTSDPLQIHLRLAALRKQKWSVEFRSRPQKDPSILGTNLFVILCERICISLVKVNRVVHITYGARRRAGPTTSS